MRADQPSGMWWPMKQDEGCLPRQALGDWWAGVPYRGPPGPNGGGARIVAATQVAVTLLTSSDATWRAKASLSG